MKRILSGLLMLAAGALLAEDMLQSLTPEELKSQWSPVKFAQLDGRRVIHCAAKIDAGQTGMNYLRFVLAPATPWDLRGKQVKLKVRSLGDGELFIVRLFNDGSKTPVRGYQGTDLLKEEEQEIQLGTRTSNRMKVETHENPENAGKVNRIEIWLGTRKSPAELSLIISGIAVEPEKP